MAAIVALPSEGGFEERSCTLVDQAHEALRRQQAVPGLADFLPDQFSPGLSLLGLRGDQLGHGAATDVAIDQSPVLPVRRVVVAFPVAYLPAHETSPPV